MKQYTANEIQQISSDFRNVACRLSRTDYSQCDTNLKRFMIMLETNELISQFITDNNVKVYDVSEMIKQRGWLDPFEVSPIPAEEISMSVQMLRYAVESFDGNFTRLYGGMFYTQAKSTANDEMRKFIEHIIDPLIDYVGEYLRKCYLELAQQEESSRTMKAPEINASNSTILIHSIVDGNVSNQVTINQQEKEDINEIIQAMQETLDSESIEYKEEIKELIEQVVNDINKDTKPKKGILTALKTLSSGSSKFLTLATALVELISKIQGLQP